MATLPRSSCVVRSEHRPRAGSRASRVGASADRLHQISADVLRVEQGSLYLALYPLEAEGLIRAEWGVSDNNRKARYYELSAAGRRRLAAEIEHWERITAAVNIVLAKA